MKIMDVSNSSKRPPHRGGGGPIQNEIVGYLKKYASQYGCSFVESTKEADVFFTNDVFPDFVLQTNKRKIKRMDGVFWNPNYSYRNIKYNEAAQQADHVIFISNYAKQSFLNLYNIPLKRDTVILNKADSSIYYSKPKSKKGVFTWIAIATDWNREEKRGNVFNDFMYRRNNDKLYLIGKTDKMYRENILSFGYITNPTVIVNLLNISNAMINFSYRDTAPKVVTQAVACGLPILYADSGGTAELVGSGIAITDSQDMIFETNVPLLNLEEIIEKSTKMVDYYDNYRNQALEALQKYRFKDMINQYFKIILDK
jgi:glycosyltransferase involved in cell wall biosynthesis